MKFFVTCAKGTEGALRRELVSLRVHAPRGDAGGVSFEGPFSDGMKACLHSRVASRVLWEVAAFEAGDADGLYTGARAVDWSGFLSPKTTLAVSATTHDNLALHHSGFAALKVKDAVVDALRDRLGARPDVNPKDPDVSLVLHLRGTSAHIYLDLAGEPLHRRGYRVAMTQAPLKETLAAAVIALGGVAPDAPFLDPMTGSGTLAIEHALAARRIAPGLGRRFGFERWPDEAQRAGFAALKEAARAGVLPGAPSSILARDLSSAAVEAARRNARAAGVGGDIRFDVGDATTSPGVGPPGTVCVNPPYGERMGKDAALYADLARAFTSMRGSKLVILCGNPELARAIARKHEISHKLWNGPLEVRLLVYR